MISTASIVGIVFSFVISAIGPIALFVFVKIKYKANFSPALVGAAGFIAFALILEQLLHSAVLPLVMGNPVLFVIYGCLAAGIFEETARLLGFLLLKKCNVKLGANNALAYGIGHGGIEAMLVVGMLSFNNLILALGINSYGAEKLAAESGENSALMLNAANQLSSVPSFMFYLAGIERILAVALHIGLTLLIWLCITKRGPKMLYPTCIVFHALANSGAAMMQAGINIPTFVIYLILIIVIVAIYTLFFSLYKKSAIKA